MSFFISLINPDTISQAFFTNNAFSFILFKFYLNCSVQVRIRSCIFSFYVYWFNKKDQDLKLLQPNMLLYFEFLTKSYSFWKSCLHR